MNLMIWIWLGMFILFFLLELEGNLLVFIWGAVGAIAALIVAWVGGGLYLQLAIAAITGIGAMMLLRKRSLILFKKKNTADKHLQRLENSPVEVLEDVTPLSGSVRIDGKIWSARTCGQNISVGEECVFMGLEGNIAKVMALGVSEISVDRIKSNLTETGNETEKG